jgi:hypothetical protein
MSLLISSYAGAELEAMSAVVVDGGSIISPLGGPGSLPRGINVTYPPVRPLAPGVLSGLASAAASGNITVVLFPVALTRHFTGLLMQTGGRQVHLGHPARSEH